MQKHVQQREEKYHGRQPTKLQYIKSIYKHHRLSYDAINSSHSLTRGIIGGDNDLYIEKI
jgi:hypothetical protein